MRQVRNLEKDRELRSETEDVIMQKLTAIDDILFDWMEEMDAPEGVTLSGALYDARNKYADAIHQYMNDLEEAIEAEIYCMDCGKLLLPDDTVWTHDSECFCKRCAVRKMIPF